MDVRYPRHMNESSDMNRWTEIITKDPGHSQRYIERFEKMEAEGRDLDGEARLIDAITGRESRILDAGCGPGRVGAKLAGLGHIVVGVDLDPVLIAAAKAKHPGATWVVGDLSKIDLAGPEVGGSIDVLVCAGNVMRFLAPDNRQAVLMNFRRSLAPSGRAVLGFGSGGGEYEFDDYRADVSAAGLVIDAQFSSWDLRPVASDPGFLISFLSVA